SPASGGLVPMQAKSYLHGSVHLSTEHKGRPRKHPVWVLRYRLPSGKASLKTSRPPAGFMTEAQANAVSQRFLDDHASAAPEHRQSFGAACATFLACCAGERGLRASTVHDYRR